MNTKQAIRDELRELESRLVGHPNHAPYQLAEQAYFSELTQLLLEGVAAFELADPAPTASRILPFEVPAGYIQGLPEPLRLQAQLRDSAATDGPYEAPAGYFENLPARLATFAQDDEGTAVRGRTGPLRSLLRRSVPWLAAAAVLSGVWFGVQRSTQPVAPDRIALTALARLDSDSIGNYIEQHVDEFDPDNLESGLAGTAETDIQHDVSELRNDEIEDYLNDGNAAAEPTDGI